MDHTADKALLRRRSAGQRFNGLKHGLRATSLLLPGESPIAYGMLVGRLRRGFKPEGAAEKVLVKLIADYLWRLKRADAVEAGLYTYSTAKAERWQGDEGDETHTLGRSFVADGKTFLHLARFRASIERPFFKALQALTAAQAERRGQVADGSEIIDMSRIRGMYTPRTAKGKEENDV